MSMSTDNIPPLIIGSMVGMIFARWCFPPNDLIHKAYRRGMQDATNHAVKCIQDWKREAATPIATSPIDIVDDAAK